MADEFVHMRHPDIEGIAGPVTKESFDLVHSKKGWEIVPEVEVVEAAVEAQIHEDKVAAITADEVDAIRLRADLDDVAVLRDIDPSEHSNMDSLREAIKATL